MVPTKTPAGWKGKNAFAWQVTATSDCQTSRTSGVNQFTIQDGVIFQNHALSYQIDRDYNQTAQVVVINKGNQPREVQVEIERVEEAYGRTSGDRPDLDLEPATLDLTH